VTVASHPRTHQALVRDAIALAAEPDVAYYEVWRAGDVRPFQTSKGRGEAEYHRRQLEEKGQAAWVTARRAGDE
jgi:hypothetical protein